MSWKMAKVLVVVWAGTMSATDVVEEVRQLVEEREALSAEINSARPQLDADERRFNREVQPDRERLKVERASLNAERPGVESVCRGQVPAEQLAAAQARCQAVLEPFNRRVRELNSRAEQNQAAINEMLARAKPIWAKQDRVKAIAARLGSLRGLLLAQLQAQCVQSCTGRSPEGTEGCLQVCYDGAKEKAEALLSGGHGTRSFGR